MRFNTPEKIQARLESLKTLREINELFVTKYSQPTSYTTETQRQGLLAYHRNRVADILAEERLLTNRLLSLK